MGNYVGNDALGIFTLAENGISDIGWSPDETRIYAATTDGKVKVFDVASHTLLTTWNLGKSLGAISLSDDGTRLVATGVSAAGTAVVFAVDTATGARSTFKSADGGFLDAELIDNQHVLLSGNPSNTIKLLDLATGKFSTVADAVRFYATSTLTEDAHLTLLGERDTSDGPVLIYDDRTGTITAQNNNYHDETTWGNAWGIQAVSEAAGLVLQFVYTGQINVFDTQLKPVKTVYLGDTTRGLSFDPTGQFVFAFDIKTGISKYRVDTWAKVAQYELPQTAEPNSIFGNQLHASRDGNTFSVMSYADIFAPDATLTLVDISTRNEVFKGTAGADTFAGGLGDDTYTVNNVGDVVKENKYAGNDKVLSSINYSLTANVETLQLVGSAALNGTGNTGDNTLIGNAGVNTLDGGRGADRIVGIGGGDTLIGGLGNDILVSGKGIDTLIGGAGNDTYIINDINDVMQEDPAGGIDTVQIAANYVLTGNLENLVLGGKAVTGIGNALANTITGNLVANTLEGRDGNDTLFGLAGKDVLNGGDGNDILDGGTGADTMTGGVGSDTYYVDHARDTIIEVIPDAGTDTVIAAINWKLGLGLENLTLAPGIAPLNGTGNDAANVLTGNDGNNRLDGGLGADTMIGGAGDDTYIVDNKGDKTIEVVFAGVDTVESSISWKLALGIDNLTLTGKAAINGTGNFLANVITGNAGDNVLDGGGVDFQFANGVDTLIGGAGNDTYMVTPFYQFTIVEKAGEGIDNCVSAVSFDALPDNVENLLLTGTNGISGGGNALANMITGNSGDNILRGYDGNDTLLGSDGKDTLDGGAGDDTMKGGAGNDSYIVDSLADKVVEKAGEGTDLVQTSITLTIPDEVERLVLIGTGGINGYGSARNDLMIGGSGVNVLEGKDGNDYLADSGNNDTLTGGTGADYFDIGSFDFAPGRGTMTTITDFSHAEQDQIYLAGIDSNPAVPGYQPLTFIGTAAFSGTAGEVRYEQKAGDTFVTGDIDGDKAIDFTIKLTGLISLTEGDFQLML